MRVIRYFVLLSRNFVCVCHFNGVIIRTGVGERPAISERCAASVCV